MLYRVTSIEPAPALKKSVSSTISGFDKIPVQISYNTTIRTTKSKVSLNTSCQLWDTGPFRISHSHPRPNFHRGNFSWQKRLIWNVHKTSLSIYFISVTPKTWFLILSSSCYTVNLVLDQDDNLINLCILLTCLLDNVWKSKGVVIWLSLPRVKKLYCLPLESGILIITMLLWKSFWLAINIRVSFFIKDTVEIRRIKYSIKVELWSHYPQLSFHGSFLLCELNSFCCFFHLTKFRCLNHTSILKLKGLYC